MRRGIIAAGNWIIDRVKMIDRWPGEGELCNILHQEASGGGGPCNVLFDLAALGCDIPLYAGGVIGSDSDGDLLLEQIHEGLTIPEALDLGAASAWFNLHSATASSGAPTLDMLKTHLAECEWNEWGPGR